MAITALYAGLLALWYLLLSARVVAMRNGAKINLGDGGNPAMLRRIRAHANFAEYVPLILVLLAVLENAQLSAPYLHLIGAGLLLGRLLHGFAMSFTEQFFLGRFLGTVLTFLTLTAAGLLCVLHGLGVALP